MPHLTKTPLLTSQRKAGYRQRMKAAGLRPVQIWLPDTRSPDFAEACRRQARAIAVEDPAGDELMQFVAETQTWPKS